VKSVKYIILFVCISLLPLELFAAECVVLLHGLARTASSMNIMQQSLSLQGYKVVNIDYPSRKNDIETLAELAVSQGVNACHDVNAEKIHFVTHSLGGILVRQYVDQHSLPLLGRVVMLGPPNQGSEVVDNLKNMPGFELLNGPAGMQLGTDESDFVANLGPVDFELGVIAGSKSINLILSTFLPNPDDGKVSAKRAAVKGMCDFVILPVTHPMMMRDREVINHVLHFLQTGRFEGDRSELPDCINNHK